MHLKPLPPPPAAPAPSPQRSARIAAVGTGVMAAPFLFLGLFFLDRPAHITLTCAPEGGACTLVRRGWMTQSSRLEFSPALLASARVDRDVRSSGKSVYRPVFDVAGTKEPLTFRWVEGGEAAKALVTRLHGYASAPEAPLVFEDDARRATAGVGGAFLGTGLGVLGLAGFFASRGWRRRG